MPYPSSASDAEIANQIPALAPLDEYNNQLLERVHPRGWTNPKSSSRYNLVVIGGGTAGLVAAAGAAGLGAKVALIERQLLGGDCLNVGCVPSKCLIRSARAVADVRDAERFGARVPAGTTVDFGAVMARMRSLRAGISLHDSAARLRDRGVDVYLGDASFSGPDRVEVEGQMLRFSRACIATGTRAAVPPIPGLQDVGYLTNETIFSLTERPRRLAVIGAGPIGCEMAQAFARFGSEVHLIEAMHDILPRDDSDGAQIVRRWLERDGVQLRCCGKDLEVGLAADGKRIAVDSHGTRYNVVVDEILVAAGRIPNVERLGLGTAGVNFDENGVTVDDFLRTTNRRIYAAGDVCSRFKFTHAADAQARIVIQNALFFGRRRASALTIPWCTYTDPEIAHVGITPAEAKKRGIQLDTFEIDLAHVDRAVIEGAEDGMLKVHTRKGKDEILGATWVARHAGEMISGIVLAMVAGRGLRDIASTIHPYPTQAEAFKHAADTYNRTRLTPTVRSLLSAFLRWRR